MSVMQIQFSLQRVKNVLGKVKNVKCALVQALRLRTGRKIHKVSKGIDLLFLNHGTGRE